MKEQRVDIFLVNQFQALWIFFNLIFFHKILTVHLKIPKTQQGTQV